MSARPVKQDDTYHATTTNTIYLLHVCHLACFAAGLPSGSSSESSMHFCFPFHFAWVLWAGSFDFQLVMSSSASSLSVSSLSAGDLCELEATFEAEREWVIAGGSGIGDRSSARGTGELGGGVIGQASRGRLGTTGPAEDLAVVEHATTCARILARLSMEPEALLPCLSVDAWASDPPSLPSSFLKIVLQKHCQ